MVELKYPGPHQDITVKEQSKYWVWAGPGHQQQAQGSDMCWMEVMLLYLCGDRSEGRPTLVSVAFDYYEGSIGSTECARAVKALQQPFINGAVPICLHTSASILYFPLEFSIGMSIFQSIQERQPSPPSFASCSFHSSVEDCSSQSIMPKQMSKGDQATSTVSSGWCQSGLPPTLASTSIFSCFLSCPVDALC